VASSGTTEIRYTVLRETETGEQVPVSPDYEFGPTDKVRLRIQANTRGLLLVSDARSATLFSDTVTPGAPAIVASDSTSLDIRFAPLPGDMGITVRNEFRPRTEPMAGLPRTGVQPLRSTATADSEQPVSSISVRLVLRRKQP
jgi:hypothetical protein